MKRTANRLYQYYFVSWEWNDYISWRGQRPGTPKGNPKKYHRVWSKSLRTHLKKETKKIVNEQLCEN